MWCVCLGCPPELCGQWEHCCMYLPDHAHPGRVCVSPPPHPSCCGQPQVHHTPLVSLDPHVYMSSLVIQACTLDCQLFLIDDARSLFLCLHPAQAHLIFLILSLKWMHEWFKVSCCLRCRRVHCLRLWSDRCLLSLFLNQPGYLSSLIVLFFFWCRHVLLSRLFFSSFRIHYII